MSRSESVWPASRSNFRAAMEELILLLKKRIKYPFISMKISHQPAQNWLMLAKILPISKYLPMAAGHCSVPAVKFSLYLQRMATSAILLIPPACMKEIPNGPPTENGLVIFLISPAKMKFILCRRMETVNQYGLLQTVMCISIKSIGHPTARNYYGATGSSSYSMLISIPK